MLIYFKKYIIAIAAIGIAIPLATSIVYSAVTGKAMATEIWGIIVLVGLFVASILIAFNLFGRRAESKVESYINLYNVECDPYAMVSKGAHLAKELTFPYTEEGAWFMGYYAQALADIGREEEARKIEDDLLASVDAAKKPLQKVRILVNLVQLAEKTGSLQDSLDLIDEGLAVIAGTDEPAAVQRRNFLANQKDIVKARMSDNLMILIGIDDTVKSNSFYPMRVRVEYAYNGAQACEKANNAMMEKANLEFVVKNGNKLAVVQDAQEQLDALAMRGI